LDNTVKQTKMKERGLLVLLNKDADKTLSHSQFNMLN